jgi:hypothetical protein
MERKRDPKLVMFKYYVEEKGVFSLLMTSKKISIDLLISTVHSIERTQLWKNWLIFQIIDLLACVHHLSIWPFGR